ncbi:MAG: aspartate aminotransferase family protein [Mariprofundales bacterium]|nr:aspartate aminotransferase family protein [Mariprofundales bacterium]
MRNFIMDSYGRFPLTIVSGEGCRVEDSEGNSYLDFVAGIAVNTLGHAHPELTTTIARQAGTLLHCSNLYHIPQQQQLAEQLAELSGLDRTFFCNSGAEANEAAIKLARKYFFDKQGDQDGNNSCRHTIITATQSFHGRTLTTVAATGQDRVKQGFSPLPTGFIHIPLNDITTLQESMDSTTAAVMLEPLQGEGGVNLARSSYLQMVRELCDRHGVLLILDEVQTGIGRTGTMFAFEQAAVKPDILTLAKGLGGGIPIGATVASERVASAFTPGSHGSTFGGNPLSCAAALCVLRVVEQQALLDNCIRMGERLAAGLRLLAQQGGKQGGQMEVRGRGLLLGLYCGQPVIDIINDCRQRGLLLVGAGADVIRMVPPLTISSDEIDEALAIIAASLRQRGWI